MDTGTDYGVQHVVETIQQTLRSYLEAQYHIKDVSLIQERRHLLESPGTIFQRPYVEATPSYRQGPHFADLEIPKAVRGALTHFAQLDPSVGIPPRPYTHQAAALEAFLGDDQNDLIVATGTGSGKTEAFLMPIFGSLLMEALERPENAKSPGIRALLLYPMNALVNDQLGRIRRIFGDERVADYLGGPRGRLVRFGSYTGRTLYPGHRGAGRDGQYVKPIFEDFYLKYADDKKTVEQLIEKGRWPSKNLKDFYGADKVTKGTWESGKRRGQEHFNWNWSQRLLTQTADRELLLRHEMQQQCPDILITNYSMLEYMLMRPIERPIFQQTREWLASDPRNQLILVLDEAHMYHGAGGAEVALLIRRFQARLGIPRERMRCILTSASLGTGAKAEAAILGFARNLTGLRADSDRRFRLLTGDRDIPAGAEPATSRECEVLAAFDLAAFQRAASDSEAARNAVLELAEGIGWETSLSEHADLGQYLFDHLQQLGPAKELIGAVSGNAVELETLATRLFPEGDSAKTKQATEALLALATFARRVSDGRVLLPSRLHLFYRGLPALYVCIDPSCDARLNKSSSDSSLMGRMYTEPRTHCDCSNGGRVFELLTHRDCGAAFIRVFALNADGDFLWHEPSGIVGTDTSSALCEIHLLVERGHHHDADDVAQVWIDIRTGKVLRQEPATSEGFLPAFAPCADIKVVEGRPLTSFRRCPVCLRGWPDGRSKIMDLATKGEAPFANIVKAQLVSQPPRHAEDDQFPNGGRKVLLFSDGRQKAARLARDIPREVELDSFRQAIALAATRLRALREPRLTRDLYVAFISVVSDFGLQFFDGDDQDRLRRDMRSFRRDYESDLGSALDDGWDVKPFSRYEEALLRQLCSTWYSLQATALGYVVPSELTKKRIARELSNLSGLTADDVGPLEENWIYGALSDFAFNAEIAASVRQRAAGYRRAEWSNRGKFSTTMRKLLRTHLALDDANITALEDIFQKNLAHPEKSGFYIDPNKVKLLIDIEQAWYQCQVCTFLAPHTIRENCANCGGSQVVALEPDSSDYLRARKGFWREPVVEALKGRGRPRHVTAEEHTAQLSQRDASAGVVYSTTEKYELRFQDIIIGNDDGPIDILSCTTTMEVGVDIGTLVAIGLRNVPPQRENYQQRAGRAGRRGSAVSTVTTYGQGGPHDSYYFHHPDRIVAGSPRDPVVQIDNAKIARRHLQSFLVQTFFHEAIDHGQARVNATSSNLFGALGTTSDFFADESTNGVAYSAFKRWVTDRVLRPDGDLAMQAASWLPPELTNNPGGWVRSTAAEFMETLSDLKTEFDKHPGSRQALDASTAEEDPDGAWNADLLAFLFDCGLLPSYAFPTDLASFLVERIDHRDGGRAIIVAQERPQQAITQALSEYAPGRLVVIDKKTYRSGGVTADVPPTELDRAAPLFSQPLPKYVHCRRCSYVQDRTGNPESPAECPVCGGQIGEMDLLRPEEFHPEEGKAIDEMDSDQEITYATTAQLPVPLSKDTDSNWKHLGAHVMMTHANDRTMVVVNKGRKGEDSGFQVCDKCGAAAPANQGQVTKQQHLRPYPVLFRPPGIPLCDGAYRNVFIGTAFKTDLLLMRLSLAHPLVTDFQETVTMYALEDALITLSEALVLGASRYLDIDPSEFAGGYRVIPRDGPEQAADVYLFDTLSGGAGYSNQAGKHIAGILAQTRELLAGCQCPRSCQDCLRHYANQYRHERLDRHLALQLMDYVVANVTPHARGAQDQMTQLTPLWRMLQLDGYACSLGMQMGGTLVPLLVIGKERQLAIGTAPALIDTDSVAFVHPLRDALDKYLNVDVRIFNEYLLDRNLPEVYTRIKTTLEAGD